MVKYGKPIKAIERNSRLVEVQRRLERREEKMRKGVERWAANGMGWENIFVKFRALGCTKEMARAAVFGRGK